MSRHTEAPNTIAFLEKRGGADWKQIASQFGITKAAVTARIRAARTYLVDQGTSLTIPRPTMGAGWKYQVTDQAYGYEHETSIARSSVDDLIAVASVSRRLVNDFDVAIDGFPLSKRRTKQVTVIRGAIGALSNVATICDDNKSTLAGALRSVTKAPATQ